MALSASTIHRYENEGRVPDALALMALADLYDRPVGEMFSRLADELKGDLSRQAGTGLSASEGKSGGSHDTDTPYLLELAREAGRREGQTAALERIADTIADEIKRLASESAVARSDAAGPHRLRRKSR